MRQIGSLACGVPRRGGEASAHYLNLIETGWNVEQLLWSTSVPRRNERHWRLLATHSELSDKCPSGVVLVGSPGQARRLFTAARIFPPSLPFPHLSEILVPASSLVILRFASEMLLPEP